jgi:hypothetical protein
MLSGVQLTVWFWSCPSGIETARGVCVDTEGESELLGSIGVPTYVPHQEKEGGGGRGQERGEESDILQQEGNKKEVKTMPDKKKREQNKTYNTRHSLVVTDPTTTRALTSLTRGERTGSRAFWWVWSYVLAMFRNGGI